VIDMDGQNGTVDEGGAVFVVSVGLGTDSEITPVIRQIIANANVLAGGKRLLERFPDFTGDIVVLDANATKEASRLLEAARRGRKVVALASGDALFHGFGRTLLDRAEVGDDIRFIPGCTAFQHLFAKLGMPWDSARFFSVHGGNDVPSRAILDSPLAVVYGGSRITAANVAARLVEQFPEFSKRRAILAENLGLPAERIRQGVLRELAEEPVGALSILLVVAPDSPAMSPTLPLGMPDDAFEHDGGMITSAEIRCVALSKLHLPPSGTLWDVGAGSGSVGIEAALLRPGLSVFAVEKSAERIERIRQNAHRHSATGLRVVHGDAPEVLEGLPNPDRAFIGGGGARNLAPLLDIVHSRISDSGIIVASAVAIESLASLSEWRPEIRTEAVTLDVATLRNAGEKLHYFKNRNRVTLYSWRKGSR
jgi:precorrin-6Y C5,15-methyltransferase (decarboxylating)